MRLSEVRHETWADVPRETVTSDIARRLFTGERMMLAQVYLDKGAVVPWHSHENEQLTWVLEGALHFWLGNEGSAELKEMVIRAGDVLFIPSNVPHKVVALEDTLDVDVLSPPRQDWLDRTDTYFHQR
jgi:quercetin dioxygenase-like cupin family protein